MISRKNIWSIIIMVLSLGCILCSMISVLKLSNNYATDQFHVLSELTEYISAKYPEEEKELLRLIKESTLQHTEYNIEEEEVLFAHGYTEKTFSYKFHGIILRYIIFIFPAFLLLLFLLGLIIKKGYRTRIDNLTKYLEQINLEKASVLAKHKEDEFSCLEDEMYKTITKLRQTKEEAIKEQSNLADSLADISHQIKTPVASISIMAQLLGKNHNNNYIDCIHKQTAHLERLVEALTTLARIDAGVLKLQKEEVNVYTMLQLSVEELEAIILEKNLQITLPNYAELSFMGDMDWSIEAFTNLIKNSIEHTPKGGSIKLEYTENPLYLQIQIEDTGEGFSESDLPHIFERFYRGEKATEGGAGIGLSLAKALIEQQNGVISAGNLTKGAYIEVRFYRH